MLPAICAKFLAIKNASKKGTAAYQNAKRAANSLYGLSQQTSNPFFQYESGQAITAFGRLTTHTAVQMFEGEGFQVGTIDTDGFEIQTDE